MDISSTFYRKDYWGGALVPCTPCRTGHASKFQVYFFKKSRKNLLVQYKNS